MDTDIYKDKYGRKLAIINVNKEVPAYEYLHSPYIVVLLVDTREDGSMDVLQRVSRELAGKNVFTIAIFVTSQFDWTFDNSLMFGINAWLTAASTEEAEEIVDSMHGIIGSNTPESLDLADIITILYRNDGRRACYGTGISNDGNLATAIANAVQNAGERGISLYDCSKVMIAVSSGTDLTKEQMTDLNGFINRLSERLMTEYEIKWGVSVQPDMPDKAVKVILLACQRNSCRS